MKCAAKNDFTFDYVPEQLPRQLVRSGFAVESSGLESAVGAWICGNVAATRRIRTSCLQFARSTMPALRGIAEDGHGVVAHSVSSCRALLQRLTNLKISDREPTVTCFKGEAWMANTHNVSLRVARGSLHRVVTISVYVPFGAMVTSTFNPSRSPFRSFSIPRGFAIRPSGSYTKQIRHLHSGCAW